MAQTTDFVISASARDRAVASNVVAIPWYIRCGLAGLASIVAGLYWDISWHMSIGRDTFWTPAHLAIQFGGILIGVTSAYMIFSTTWGSNRAVKNESVTVWGFRGPLGAFLSCWGGATMVTSAPFDNWWHNAFGLDVRIVSPPHAVLGLGIFAAGAGVLMLILGRMNRAEGAAREELKWAFLWAGGLLLVLHMILSSEYSDGTLMHSAIFYRVQCIAVPLILVTIARASGYRWGATVIAAIYMISDFAQLWILPLFPATPKLGPVMTKITHMVPLGPPVFLIIPALAVDWVLNRYSVRYASRNKWILAALLGTAFFIVLWIVHWPLGTFMLSRYARNRIFGMNYFPYQFPDNLHYLAWRFRKFEPTQNVFWRGMAIAFVTAIVSSRIGLAAGDAMRRVRR